MTTETASTARAPRTAAPVSTKKGWWPKWLNLKVLLGLIAAFWIGFWVNAPRGAPFVTSVQSEVLIPGIDVDGTLVVAEQELMKTGFASVLTIWGIRDQIFTQAQARTVSSLYFQHVGSMEDYFRLWHLTWAVSNVYRNGSAAVRAELELAYLDAAKRAKILGGFADAHVNGPIVMGDIHYPARLFVQSHVVAPGAAGYLQSLEDYKP